LIKTDGPSVLFTPKDELGFLFAAGRLPPDRQGYRHQDAHDGDAHEQGRHGVTPRPTENGPVLPVLPVLNV
jgi:hypothetical protein